jgi:hypothetical protein
VPLHDTGEDLDRLAGTLNRMLDRIAGLVEYLAAWIGLVRDRTRAVVWAASVASASKVIDT